MIIIDKNTPIFKKIMVKKLFNTWKLNTSYKLDNEFENICKLKPISYIKENNTNIRLLISSFNIIYSQYISFISNINFLIISNIIENDILLDYYKYCIKRGLEIRHWIIQLSSTFEFDVCSLPKPNFNVKQLDILFKKFNYIYKEEQLKFIHKLTNEDNIDL